MWYSTPTSQALRRKRQTGFCETQLNQGYLVRDLVSKKVHSYCELLEACLGYLVSNQ